MKEDIKSTMDVAGKVGSVIIMLAIVLLLAYVVTKIISGQYSKSGTGKNITVLERIPLTRDSALILARIGDGYFVLGATAHTINIITRVDETELTISDPGAKGAGKGSGQPFSQYLQKIRDSLDKKRDEDGQE